MKPVLKKVCLTALALFGFSVGGCSAFLFHPDDLLRLTPKDLNIAYERKSITSLDGVKLVAWHLKTTVPCKGTVLFLHGNAENISTHIGSVYWLPRYGYDVLLLDYRGYGGSEGSAFTAGVHRDALAAIDYVLDRENFCGEARILFGQSLGGAIAVTALAESGRSSEFDALVVESTFGSYAAVAREVLGRIPIVGLLRWPLSLFFPERYSPELYISELAPLPVLIIHGDTDQIVPIAHGRRLFAAARAPAAFWRLPGGGHIASAASPAARERFLGFLNAAAAKASVRSQAWAY